MVGSDDRADDREDEPVTQYPITDALKKACPYFMLFGMSYDQYWDGDPDMLPAFRKAYELKLQDENYKMWMQGLYNYSAICSVAPVLVSFPDKSAKIAPYMKNPIPITAQDVKKQQIEKEKEIAESWKNYLLWKGSES